MMRNKLLLALFGMSLCAAGVAAEQGMCKSICASGKKECRAEAVEQTKLDRDPLITPDDKNPYVRSNSGGQVPTPEARAREQADTRNRMAERNGQCDTAYLRCVRACDAPAPGGSDSVILRRRPEAGGATTAKP